MIHPCADLFFSLLTFIVEDDSFNCITLIQAFLWVDRVVSLDAVIVLELLFEDLIVIVGQHIANNLLALLTKDCCCIFVPIQTNTLDDCLSCGHAFTCLLRPDFTTVIVWSERAIDKARFYSFCVSIFNHISV